LGKYPKDKLVSAAREARIFCLYKKNPVTHRQKKRWLPAHSNFRQVRALRLFAGALARVVVVRGQDQYFLDLSSGESMHPDLAPD
jgi:hypothetical protein